MKKRHILPTAVILLLILICFSAFTPLLYGGAGPMDRLMRFDDGGNFAKVLADGVATGVIRQSGAFDITLNGQQGVFIYNTDLAENKLETYHQIGFGNNIQASYILFKNGVQYCFSMNADGWHFDSSRVCRTDFRRLLGNLAGVMTDKEIATDELSADLNALVGFDLTKYFKFEIVPTVVRSLCKSLDDESFQTAAGYHFSREGFALQYTFAPENNHVFAEKLNAVLSIAYTDTTRSIMNIAGIAGSFADLFGFNLPFPDADITITTSAFSGKILSVKYEGKNTSLLATNRKYGNCDIRIESAQLEALLIEHVV